VATTAVPGRCLGLDPCIAAAAAEACTPSILEIQSQTSAATVVVWVSIAFVFWALAQLPSCFDQPASLVSFTETILGRSWRIGPVRGTSLLAVNLVQIQKFRHCWVGCSHLIPKWCHVETHVPSDQCCYAVAISLVGSSPCQLWLSVWPGRYWPVRKIGIGISNWDSLVG
jgi:hypothetical protein